MRLITYLCCCLLFQCLIGDEIVVRSPEGESHVIEVKPEDTFLFVVQEMRNCFGGHEEFLLDFMMTPVALSQEKAASVLRNYQIPVTLSEKKDISYIVNTLGMSSLTKIAKLKSHLKKAGKRIDHVHPLRFLMCIFTDEPMKASMQSIQNRSWVWGEFMSGLKTSLEEESVRDNLKLEFLYDFAAQLGVGVEVIYPPIFHHQWNDLVRTLINVIPRSTDSNRYDEI